MKQPSLENDVQRGLLKCHFVILSANEWSGTRLKWARYVLSLVEETYSFLYFNVLRGLHRMERRSKQNHMASSTYWRKQTWYLTAKMLGSKMQASILTLYCQDSALSVKKNQKLFDLTHTFFVAKYLCKTAGLLTVTLLHVFRKSSKPFHSAAVVASRALVRPKTRTTFHNFDKQICSIKW